MKSPEEYIKQYAPLKMYGTEYLHKDTVLKIIEEAQKIQFQKEVEQVGGLYRLFRSADEGIEILREYLKGIQI